MKEMSVEAKDVKFFDISLVPGRREPVVHINGLVFHSSMAVKRIETKVRGDASIVNVVLTPARAGLSGRFEVEVPLAKEVQKILFGPSEVQIWPVAAGQHS